MLLIARFAVVMINDTSLIDWASRRVLCQSQQPNVAVNTAHNKIVSGLTHQASHFVTLNSGGGVSSFNKLLYLLHLL